MIRDTLTYSIDLIQTRANSKHGVSGVPSGFHSLDKITSGWQESELTIIAGRPGMGKTSLLISVLRNAAIDFNIPVAIFSLEMSSVQLVNRLISSEAELPSEKIKKGDLADYEWEQMIHKTRKLSEAPIFIDDTPEISIQKIREKSRDLVSKQGVKLIAVDFLQMIRLDEVRSIEHRESEIEFISRELKNMARELGVSIIATSQLNRAVETRGGERRPILSDLKGSGSIEQYADIVMFLYRPEYYGLDIDELGMPLQGLGEVIIAKHRNGSLDTVNLKFIAKLTKFTNWGEDEIGDDSSADSPSISDFTITLPSMQKSEDDSGHPF